MLWSRCPGLGSSSLSCSTLPSSPSVLLVLSKCSWVGLVMISTTTFNLWSQVHSCVHPCIVYSYSLQPDLLSPWLLLRDWWTMAWPCSLTSSSSTSTTWFTMRGWYSGDTSCPPMRRSWETGSQCSCPTVIMWLMDPGSMVPMWSRFVWSCIKIIFTKISLRLAESMSGKLSLFLLIFNSSWTSPSMELFWSHLVLCCCPAPWILRDWTWCWRCSGLCQITHSSGDVTLTLTTFHPMFSPAPGYLSKTSWLIPISECLSLTEVLAVWQSLCITEQWWWGYHSAMIRSQTCSGRRDTGTQCCWSGMMSQWSVSGQQWLRPWRARAWCHL